eukprot:GFUD01089690.1.p1 GENE.GFUD01089690.1~~GFUD01089690.1.p1  ORF type:complete len:125 (+),score=12.12 GFUD01089690.1:319-693(+)
MCLEVVWFTHAVIFKHLYFYCLRSFVLSKDVNSNSPCSVVSANDSRGTFVPDTSTHVPDNAWHVRDVSSLNLKANLYNLISLPPILLRDSQILSESFTFSESEADTDPASVASTDSCGSPAVQY